MSGSDMYPEETRFNDFNNFYKHWLMKNSVTELDDHFHPLSKPEVHWTDSNSLCSSGKMHCAYINTNRYHRSWLHDVPQFIRQILFAVMKLSSSSDSTITPRYCIHRRNFHRGWSSTIFAANVMLRKFIVANMSFLKQMLCGIRPWVKFDTREYILLKKTTKVHTHEHFYVCSNYL